MRGFLQRAVTLDPRFAPAHAMLAFLHVAEATRGIGSSESSRMAEAEARTAVDLDPRSGTAHAMLAWTYGHQGDWGPALEEAETAITLNPNDPWGYLSKGHSLLFSGRPAGRGNHSPSRSGLILTDPPRRRSCTSAWSAVISKATISPRKHWRAGRSGNTQGTRVHTCRRRLHLGSSAAGGGANRVASCDRGFAVDIQFLTDCRPPTIAPRTTTT